MFEGISSLVEKSLLVRQADPDGTTRFRMLDTIREFAIDELAASGELALFQRRLTDAVLGLGEAAELDGPRQGWWLARLDAERDNIRAVLAWTIEQGQPDRGCGCSARCFAGLAAPQATKGASGQRSS
jgi:predicted ATPase